MMKCILIPIVLFVLASCGETASKPEVKTGKDLNLLLPRDAEQTSTSIVAGDKAITFILAGGDSIYYYEGRFREGVVTHTIGYAALRGVLLDCRQRIGDSLMVLIKPHPDATYRNTVDVLDEMTVNHIQRYALVDLLDEEREHILQEPVNEATQLSPPLSSGTPVTQGIRRRGIVFTIAGDGSITWQSDDLQKRSPVTVLQPATKESVKVVVNAFRSGLGEGGKRLEVVVRGHPSSAYKTYAPVVLGLKEAGIWDFKTEVLPDN